MNRQIIWPKNALSNFEQLDNSLIVLKVIWSAYRDLHTAITGLHTAIPHKTSLIVLKVIPPDLAAENHLEIDTSRVSSQYS